ncbi:MAG: extracellular solute-binding protein [Halanaerobium sp.]
MEKTLKVWLIITSREHDVLKFLDEKFSQFEDQHQLKIELKLITWNRAFETIIEAFKNNNAPDIIQIGTTWVRTLAYMGYLDQAPPNFEVRKSFIKNMNQICSYQGEQYAVPWNVDTIVLAARTDYLQQLGLKKSELNTWKKFRQACQDITEKKQTNSELPQALAFSLRAEADLLHRFSGILWSKGWQFPDLYQVPEKILTQKKVLENISFLADLILNSDVNASDLDKHPYQLNNEFYRHGAYVFYIGSWYGIIEDISHNPVSSQNGDFNYTILPFPTEKNNKSTGYGGGSVLAVSASSKQKQKAWKLVEYFLKDDFINEWIAVTGKVPAFEVDFWQQKDVDQRIKTMYQQSINSKTYPPYPAWATIEKMLSTAVAHSIWELIDKNTTEINSEAYSLLKKSDQNIKKLLKMSWEMRDYA